MSLRLDPECQQAIDLAKRALPDGEPIDVVPLLAAVYHSAKLQERFPQFQRFLNEPTLVRESAGAVPVAPALKEILERLQAEGRAISAERLFNALIASEAGQTFLSSHGMAAPEPPRLSWRESPERSEAIQSLSRYGRFLTETTDVADRGHTEMEASLQALIVTLSQMKRRNALVVGPAGSGKTGLVYELARRLVAGHASIPPHLEDLDVFELSSGLLRAGAGLQDYEGRLETIKDTLFRHKQIVLFVDEVHAVLQAAAPNRTVWVEINERVFKEILSSGKTSCIACTTTEEYRNFIKPDAALDRRFELITLQPPTAAATRSILEARLPRVLEHYAPLAIPTELLERAVKLTDEHLPSRYQPDKSIRLLDRACALAVTDSPPAGDLTEEYLVRALEATVGEFIRPGELTESAVYQKLRAKIVGQDDCLRRIAAAVVAGLGKWRGTGPRAVFLFGGPTGVGKTEAALVLAKILGPGRDRLIRVDCNTLQGTAYEGVGSITSRLLGAAPGYVGYVPGGGGLLSKVRDTPECVLLFDEFEKAHPAVGQLILRIIDDGMCENSVGSLLDFRRAFVILTTNAGSTYETGLGFVREDRPPSVDEAGLVGELTRLTGLGPEFFGRIANKVLFRGLDESAIREILMAQLGSLREMVAKRGLELTWEDDLAEHLLSQWQSRYGVRHLTAILRNRVVERLNIADAEGDLQGVEEIQLRLLGNLPHTGGLDLTGLVTHERQGRAFIISIA